MVLRFSLLTGPLTTTLHVLYQALGVAVCTRAAPAPFSVQFDIVSTCPTVYRVDGADWR